jgi:hypothetical protein
MRNGVGKSHSHVGVLTPRSDLTQDEIPGSYKTLRVNIQHYLSNEEA